MKFFDLLTLSALLTAVSATAAEPTLKLKAAPPEETTVFSIVSVKLTLQNAGPDTVPVLRFPDAHSATVEVQDASSGKTVYKGPVEVSQVHGDEGQEPEPVDLKSGGKHSFDLELKCRWGVEQTSGFMFEQAGDYKLRFTVPVTYLDGTTKTWLSVESDWAGVSVKGLGPSEAEPVKQLLASANACWLFEPQQAVMFTPEKDQNEWRAALAKFLDTAPDSDWSPFAHVALAFLDEDKGLRSKDAETKSNSLASAKNHLDQALQHPAFHGSEKARSMRESIVVQQKVSEK